METTIIDGAELACLAGIVVFACGMKRKAHDYSGRFRSRDFISAETGFDSGDRFTSDEMVRDYFTAENLFEMFGTRHDYFGDAELREMADAVIDNRWHCEF